MDLTESATYDSVDSLAPDGGEDLVVDVRHLLSKLQGRKCFNALFVRTLS